MSQFEMGHPDETSLERTTLRKISFRLVPFICILYIFNILDRSNIGFARLSMEGDLGITKATFDTAYGLFYIGYLFFEVPSNLLLRKIGARIWISRIMVTWGICSVLTMFVQTETHLNIVRILLGIAEAGFFPGIILYLTCWFPARERARVVALFMMAIAFANVFGNPASGLIVQGLDEVAGLHGWQWLFLLEGLPSIILGITVLWYLPNGPMNAPWLTTEESAWITKKLITERSDRMENKGSDHLLSMFDPRVFLLTCLYFTVAVGTNATGAYLPTLVQNHFPLKPFEIGLLSAMPHITSVILMIMLSRFSDQTGKRSIFVALGAGIGSLGWLIAWQAPDRWIALGGLCMAQAGMMAMLPVFWTLPSSFLGGAAAAGGIAFINSVANIGGYFGATILGKYGLGTLSLIMACGIFLAIAVGMFVETKNPKSGEV